MTPDDSKDPFPDYHVSPFDMNPNVQAWRLIQMEKTVKNLEKGQNHIIQMMTTIQQAPAIQRPCPLPGACVGLESRVHSLEEDRTALRGGWKAVARAAVVASGLTGMVTGVWGLFRK